MKYLLPLILMLSSCATILNLDNDDHGLAYRLGRRVLQVPQNAAYGMGHAHDGDTTNVGQQIQNANAADYQQTQQLRNGF